MDKKLARQFVAKVHPLEHSDNPKDRKAARVAEKKLRRILRTIPARMKA
jgi:hypothetical protein